MPSDFIHNPTNRNGCKQTSKPICRGGITNYFYAIFNIVHNENGKNRSKQADSKKKKKIGKNQGFYDCIYSFFSWHYRLTKILYHIILSHTAFNLKQIMERERGKIVPIRPFRFIENEDKPSIVQNVISTILEKANDLLRQENTPENEERINSLIENILKSKGCVLKLSNELFEEIQEHLDDIYSMNSELASVPKVIFNTLWSYCPSFISGQKICEELLKTGIQIPGPAEIKRLVKRLNSNFIVPKIIGFQSVFDPNEMSYIFCEVKEPLFSKYSRILHRNAIV